MSVLARALPTHPRGACIRTRARTHTHVRAHALRHSLHTQLHNVLAKCDLIRTCERLMRTATADSSLRHSEIACRQYVAGVCVCARQHASVHAHAHAQAHAKAHTHTNTYPGKIVSWHSQTATAWSAGFSERCTRRCDIRSTSSANVFIL